MINYILLYDCCVGCVRVSMHVQLFIWVCVHIWFCIFVFFLFIGWLCRFILWFNKIMRCNTSVSFIRSNQMYARGIWYKHCCCVCMCVWCLSATLARLKIFVYILNLIDLWRLGSHSCHSFSTTINLAALWVYSNICVCDHKKQLIIYPT